MSFGEVVCYAKHFFGYEIFGGILQKIIVGRFHSIRFDSILFDLIRSGLVEPSVCALCIADSKKSDKPKRPKSMKQTAVRQVSNIIQIQMEFSYQPFFRHFLCMTEPNQHNIGNDLLNWLCHTYTTKKSLMRSE